MEPIVKSVKVLALEEAFVGQGLQLLGLNMVSERMLSLYGG